MPVFLNDGSQLVTFDYKFIEKDTVLNVNSFLIFFNFKEKYLKFNKGEQ